MPPWEQRACVCVPFDRQLVLRPLSSDPRVSPPPLASPSRLSSLLSTSLPPESPDRLTLLLSFSRSLASVSSGSLTHTLTTP